MSSDLPALLGGTPVNGQHLPPYNTIGEEEKRAVMEVLDSGVLSGFAAQPNDDHLALLQIQNRLSAEKLNLRCAPVRRPMKGCEC